MTFKRWDKTAKVKYDKRTLSQLASLGFVDALQNVIILGPVGVEKIRRSRARSRRLQSRRLRWLLSRRWTAAHSQEQQTRQLQRRATRGKPVGAAAQCTPLARHEL